MENTHTHTHTHTILITALHKAPHSSTETLANKQQPNELFCTYMNTTLFYKLISSLVYMYMSTLKCMHKQTVTKQKAIIILFLSTVCISSFHLLYRNDWSHSRTYTHTHTPKCANTCTLSTQPAII